MPRLMASGLGERDELDRTEPNLVTKHRINLLVIGTVGRAKAPGVIIGNSAERIIERVNCWILAVKPDDFISPVASAVSR